MSEVASNFAICWKKTFFSILELEGYKLQIRYIWWRWSRICGQIYWKIIFESIIDFFRFSTFRPCGTKTFYFWTSEHPFLNSTCSNWPDYVFSSRFEHQKIPTVFISRNWGHLLIGSEKGSKRVKNRMIFKDFAVWCSRRRVHRLGFWNTMTLSLEPCFMSTNMKKKYS